MLINNHAALNGLKVPPMGQKVPRDKMSHGQKVPRHKAPRTKAFCPVGRFVSWDVFVRGTFCPIGRFFLLERFVMLNVLSVGVLSYDLLS